MTRKGGNETVLGSARFRCSSMGECDTYLEFCMSKDSIGAAEFGFGQPCTAQGQFKSRKGAKMSPWRQPGDNLATSLPPGCRKGVPRLLKGCRKGDLFAPLQLLNCPCAVQGWPTPSSAAPIESLDM